MTKHMKREPIRADKYLAFVEAVFLLNRLERHAHAEAYKPVGWKTAKDLAKSAENEAIDSAIRNLIDG